MEVVIVGGGVAGLSCLNALLDYGISALLIEGSKIGSYKLCGEFLSPYAKESLAAWNIGPIQAISDVYIENLHIQMPAGAMSRAHAELELAKRARNLGGEILEEVKVIDISPSRLLLDDNKERFFKKLVVASGKFSSHPKDFPYIGLKAHVTHSHFEPKLTMQLFKGGYFGSVPISNTTSNIACLMKKEASPPLDLDWHRAQVPNFGFKKVPCLPNSYWIGDAAASFPPATGQGFAHAILSGKLAARYIATNTEGFQQKLHTLTKAKMHYALAIHQLMLSPLAAKLACRMLSHLPNKFCSQLAMLEGD